jgi:hypothetical protein
MIALLVALSFATAASHGHKSVHPHKHKPPPTRIQRCRNDAKAVRTLEERIGSAGVRQAELNKLETQLERAVERAKHDCGP